MDSRSNRIETRNEKSKPTGEYPLKSQIFEVPVDPRNAWVNETYRHMVYYVLRNNKKALNINQITEKLRDIRKDWQEFAPDLPKNANWELPKGNPTRKTVSRHLKEMQARGFVVSIGGLYATTSKHMKNAEDINQAVRHLISTQNPEKWHFIHAAPAAGCYVFSDPPRSHWRFQDILHWQQHRFGDSLFWFDDILRYLISIGALPTNTYSNHELDTRLLKKGWEKCFSKTKLVILAFAFSPSKLLEFLSTYPGKSWAETRLDKNWNEIKSLGEKDRPLYQNWSAVYSEEKNN